jgi:UDP-N-acetylmuramoyl-L-alanyl-D-glutamate--2,6-diaminopimelate ligase
MAVKARSAGQCLLSELLDGHYGDTDVTISGVQFDSRKVNSGHLFLAVPGEKYDGRQFIEQAVANGAAAIVAEPPVEGFVDEIPVPLVQLPDLQQETGLIAARFYQHPSAAMYTVGVTGTNGKTTTTRLIAQLAHRLGSQCGSIGTLGASLDDKVAESGNTTPDAVSLQACLAQWRDQGVEIVSMEVSSHALVQGRVNGVDFTTAVFTNLSHDHLDYHGDMAAYGKAKGQLFGVTGLRNAVINLDDEYAGQLLAGMPAQVSVFTYSARGDAAADVRVEGAQFHATGVRGRLCTPWGDAEFNSPLPGEFNLANLAAAVAAVTLEGRPFTQVIEAVSALGQVPGRMQSLPNDLGFQVIVDYAHTPDALEHILNAVRTHVPGEVITVFGCGGDRDAEKRPVMGRIACELSDQVIVTSDNPRSEDPLAIMGDIQVGCIGSYSMVSDRREAIVAAINSAVSGDCVVIAGKGHEDYQEVNGERQHFSDEIVAREALAARAQS